MHRIDGPGATVDNKFTEGDPVGGVQATLVGAAWLNDVQENVMAVLVAAGVAPTKGRAADLLDSIKKLAPGRLLRKSVYINNAGTLQVSVNGAAFVTAASTFTPLALTTAIHAIGQGAGSAGAGSPVTTSTQVGCGAGGSAGALCEGFYTSGFSGASIVVGAGGVGVAGAGGGAGGSTALGALFSAPGGPGSPAATAQVPPTIQGNTLNSGTASGGNIFNGAGQSGEPAVSLNTNAYQSGRGASSAFGAGGRGIGSSYGAGAAGAGYGSGGGGAQAGISSGAGLAGGNGVGGILIIEEFAF